MRFSVIITCFNQREFIADAVDSALRQSAAGHEVIVVDDASTDGSRQILEAYGEAIRLVPNQKNLGASTARNRGARLARGDYIVFLDGDDALKPWALEVYSHIIGLKRPQLILGHLVFGHAIPSGDQEAWPAKIELVDYELFLKKDRTYWTSASTIVVHRETFLDVKGWSQDMFPLEDYDLLTKLGNSGRAIQVISPATVFYRVHDANSVHRIPWWINNAHRLVQKVKSGDYPGIESRRFEVYAFAGGPVAYWVKRGYHAGLRREALALMANGWSVILATIIRKLAVRIKGRRRIEIVDYKPS